MVYFAVDPFSEKKKPAVPVLTLLGFGLAGLWAYRLWRERGNIRR
ncbi:MAG TPA: hypothetical protein VL688_09755 [Verrucomicrobiae bacterium]|nr:hypothetical protein [Verrucomicrobiae bacterium]